MTHEQMLRDDLARLERSHARLLDQVNELERELARVREESIQSITKLELKVWDLSHDQQTAEAGKRKAEDVADSLKSTNRHLSDALKRTGKL